MKKGLVWGFTAVLSVALAGWWGAESLGFTKSAPQLFYVPNAGEGSVSIVDPEQGKTVETIPLGSKQASHGIALSPDGNFLYSGTGFEGKSLVAIDTTTKKIAKELKFNDGVHGIDISPNGKSLYVSLNPGLGKKGGGLAVVDAGKLEQTALIQTGEGPAHVAVTTDGSQVWVANVNGNTVAVVDAQTNQLLKVIPVGKVPNEVAVSPDGKWAFVANVNSNNLTVIDAKELRPVKEIRAGEAPHGVTVSPNGKEIWIANNKSNDVSVVDAVTLQTVANIPTGAYANHVAFSPDGKWAYVTNRQSNDVVKIDVGKRTIIARIPVGAEPHEISLEDYVVLPTEKASEDANPQSPQTVGNLETKASSLEQRSQTAQAGDVAIDIQRLLPEDFNSKQPPKNLSPADFANAEVFRISLTAHAGDLSSLPLNKNLFLVAANGEKIAPANWIVESQDSHHPQYLAVFPKTESVSFSIEVGGLGDKPVVMTWKTN